MVDEVKAVFDKWPHLMVVVMVVVGAVTVDHMILDFVIVIPVVVVAELAAIQVKVDKAEITQVQVA